MQLAVNHVSTWATSHGFKFSTAKTVSILFHRKRKIQPPPQLFLNNQPIPSKTSIKYLGMILDEKLTWQKNIKDLKIDCTRRLDLLKTLSHTTWGSDRTTMLRLYRSIIRSKLDYCSFIYATAKPYIIKSLDSIHHTAIRLCTGAFRSSPIESLYSDSGEPSLYKRRMQLLLQFYVRSQQLANTSIIPFQQNIEQPNVQTPLIANTIHETLLSLNMSNIPVMPFHYTDSNKWLLPDIICNGFDCPSKKNINDHNLKQLFIEHCTLMHNDEIKIFTDGSRKVDCVGSAAVSDDRIIKKRLPPIASIFTVELKGVMS